ncbi:MAG: FmdB family zinc ribbon protein [Solirubrobacteraceae bacterium]|jgi:putative FmdB family regulatory protein
MPTYEYRCPKGHSFEVVQGINDPPLTKCQVCGRPVERVLHSPAVHFKGSGFYNTDYGTKKRQREKSSGDSGSSESSSSSSSSSGDAKPATSESGGGGDSKSSSDKPKPAPAAD